MHILAANLKKKGYNIYCDEGSVDVKMPPAKAAELDQAAVVVQNNAVQNSVVQYSIVQYSSIQCNGNTIQCNTL